MKKNLLLVLLFPVLCLPGCGNSHAKNENRTMDERQLITIFPDSVSCSSYLKNDSNLFDENYHPFFVFDEDSATGWVTSGNFGVGENMTLYFSSVTTAGRIRFRIRNGCQSSSAAYFSHSRPSKLGLSCGQKEIGEMQLRDQAGVQEFDFPLPEDFSLSSLTIAIRGVKPGAIPGCWLGKIEIEVSAPDSISGLMQDRKNAVMSWIKRRKAVSDYIWRGIPNTGNGLLPREKEIFSSIISGEEDSLLPVSLLEKNTAKVIGLFSGLISEEQVLWLRDLHRQEVKPGKPGYSFVRSPLEHHDLHLPYGEILAPAVYMDPLMLKKALPGEYIFSRENKGATALLDPFTMLSGNADSVSLLYSEWHQRHTFDAHPEESAIDGRYFFSYGTNRFISRVAYFNDSRPQISQEFALYEFVFSATGKISRVKSYSAAWNLVEQPELVVRVKEYMYP